MAPICFFPDADNDVVFDGRYLFDTNVWFKLQGPYPDFQDERTRNYSRIMKKILDDGGVIIVDPVVIMEFSNLFIRTIFNAERDDGNASDNFKEFRKTNAYNEITKTFADEIFQLVNGNEVIGVNFSAEDYDKISESLHGSSLDFNDAIILETCKRSELTLVTDDFDYAGCDVPVISANRRYRN